MLESWKAAMRWRREVERELAAVGLTFIQWLVLDAAAALVDERRDAVSQLDIGRRVELDKATISDVMTRLVMRGLVDRDIDDKGICYRIYITDSGELALEQGRDRISLPHRVPLAAARGGEEGAPGSGEPAIPRGGAREGSAACRRAREERDPGARELEPVLALGAVEPTVDAVRLLEVATDARAALDARHRPARAREVAGERRARRRRGGRR
jgi:DNA-binding MarR family transcriptional regulator